MAGLRERLGPGGTAIAVVLLLAGCSGEKAADPTTSPAESPPVTGEPSVPAPAPAPAEGATTGGDGSAIELSALSAADMQANPLGGELACSFSSPTQSPLLVAQGVVASREPAQGLVKVGSYVERVAAPGGFDGMLKGATFTGAGKTITIAVTGPATGGGESPPSPATLSYQRADGASLTLAGRWECGP